MKLRQPSRMRKRDGREVPFDRDKIQSAVQRAQAAVGEEDPQFAREVADLVTLTLGSRVREGAATGGGLPGIEEIQDLVERALIELGAAPVAKAYILYRDRRARSREQLERAGKVEAPAGSTGATARGVSTDPDPDPATPPRGLRVREADSLGQWSKGRIVAALMNEAELSRSVAEEVAGRVERRVFASGMRRVSTALIRELVAGELAEMGLSKALARQGVVGLPRHDLRELFERRVGARSRRGAGGGRTSPAGTTLRDGVSAAVLRRYLLEDVLDELSADRVLSGELFVEDLSSAHLHLGQSIPADLLLAGEPSASAAFRALDELGLATGAISSDVVLEEPARLFGSGGRGLREESLASWLSALSALARASDRRFALSGLSSGPAAFLSRLVQAMARKVDEDELARPARLYLTADELETLGRDDARRADLDLLLARGVAVPTFAPAGERVVGPGLVRRSRERGALGLGAVVALNLPRLAHRAGPWREERLFEHVASAVGEAVALCSRLSTFQRRVHHAREGEIRGRTTYAITVCGLRESLRVLGDGEVSAELGARLLGLCDEAARRFSAENRLALSLIPDYGGRAARHFAFADRARPRADQGLLFPGVVPEDEADVSPAYGHGFAIGDAAEHTRIDAAALLLSTVPRASLPTVFRGEDGAPGDGLFAWERFESARRERRGAGRAPVTESDAAPVFEWAEEGAAASLQSPAGSANLAVPPERHVT